MEYLDIVKTFWIENWENFFGIVGVIGTIFTICSFYLKHGYRLGYVQNSSFPLMLSGKLANDMQILYKGKSVSRIKEKYYRIFNVGDKALRKDDLFNNKLTISIEDGRIFDIQLFVKDKSQNVKLKRINDKKYIINFDYFDMNQIIDIVFVHSGIKENIECHAPGMKNIKKYRRKKSLDALCVISAFTILWGMILYNTCINFQKDIISVLSIIFIGFLFIACLWGFLRIIPRVVRSAPRRILKYSFDENSQKYINDNK